MQIKPLKSALNQVLGRLMVPPGVNLSPDKFDLLRYAWLGLLLLTDRIYGSSGYGTCWDSLIKGCPSKNASRANANAYTFFCF